MALGKQAKVLSSQQVQMVLSFLATKYGYKVVTAGEILTSLTEAFRGGAGNTLTAL